ncbi:MAG: hypothetical protein SPI72_05725, partial [Porphyromonas sp.]|nr:hypothetical protein [Porphyromonas sp.]
SAADALAQIIAKLEAIKAAIENNAADVVAVMTTEKNVGDEIELKFSPSDSPIVTGAAELNSKKDGNWVKRTYRLASKNIAIKGMVTMLSCEGNQLTNLDVRENKQLQVLVCRDNQLTTLDVSKNTHLMVLFCDKNQLETLDVSKNPLLTELICNNNKIKDLTVPTTSSGRIHFKSQSGDNNQLSTDQVNAIRGKGWKILQDNGTSWVDYPGE